MAFRGSVLALALAATAARDLPAPMSDFYLEGPLGHESNFSYMNTATLGPAPRAVVEALSAAAADNEKNPNVDVYEYFKIGAELVRHKAAKFLGCSDAEVLLTPSTTFGLNTVGDGLIASGFVGAGDRVLTTDQEHYGATNVWRTRANATGFSIDEVAVPLFNATAAGVLAAFEAKLNATTYKVVAVAHTGADAYATSSHKWGLGPKGSGLLCVKESAQPKVQATYLAGGYGRDIGALPDAYGVKTSSSGTVPPAIIAGQGAAFDYLADFGMADVEQHNMGLRARAAAAFSAMGCAPLGALDPAADSAPILTIALPDSHDATWTYRKLWLEYGIFVKSTGAASYPTEWPPGAPQQAIRFSFHVYNTETDVDRLVAAVAKILGDATVAVAV
ncbi:cysteine desulfurase [Aureococcus anophagefferens]|nr:cysteine desulfurase [Aureococcus anophagefferens]